MNFTPVEMDLTKLKVSSVINMLFLFLIVSFTICY